CSEVNDRARAAGRRARRPLPSLARFDLPARTSVGLTTRMLASIRPVVGVRPRRGYVVLGRSSPVRRLGASLAALSAALMVVLLGSPAQANVAIKVVSQDTFTNLDSGVYHATEVEPDTFSHGGTTVSIFQVGRYQDGGASAIGWATSTDYGRSWTNGTLPDLTVNTTPPG